MKKLIAFLLLILTFALPSFAAVATVTKTPYGFSITGGTSATAVNSGDSLNVKELIFSSATSTDTVTVTSETGDTTFAILTGATNARIFLGDTGAVLTNIKVTLSATGAVLTIVNKG